MQSTGLCLLLLAAFSWPVWVIGSIVAGGQHKGWRYPEYLERVGIVGPSVWLIVILSLGVWFILLAIVNPPWGI